jgi:hypothetical protein
MPRAVYPHPLACIQLALRWFLLFVDSACFTTAVYVSFHDHGAKLTNALLYTGLVTSFAIDNAEIIPLWTTLDLAIRRIPFCLLFVADALRYIFLVIALFIKRAGGAGAGWESIAHKQPNRFGMALWRLVVCLM